MRVPLDGPLTIVQGSVIAYRLFELAYAIDLGRAEQIWLARGASTARTRLSSTPAKAVSYDVPPLVLALEPVTLELADGPLRASVSAKLYDFGILTVAVTVPAAGLSWEGFSARVEAVNQHIGPASGSVFWGERVEALRAVLQPAFDRPATLPLDEDYLIALVRSFDRPMNAVRVQSELDLVPLLSGEQLPLSDGARHDLLRKRFSYYVDDLAVLTWDRAFVLEPRGDTDVIDVLEVANAQLLEMRYYDELLDDELPRMYDLVESTRRTSIFVASRRYASLARRLHMLVAEVTELTEKVDNALQVTEDVYLARIYAGALDLFRVASVSAAVDRKLSIIRDTYSALYEEASGGRAAVLESVVVLLILAETLLALLHH